jgi:hypothetical protein
MNRVFEHELKHVRLTMLANKKSVQITPWNKLPENAAKIHSDPICEVLCGGNFSSLAAPLEGALVIPYIGLTSVEFRKAKYKTCQLTL